MFTTSSAPLTSTPFPCLPATAWLSMGWEPPWLRSTVWLCRKSHVADDWLSQEVRPANKEACCRGFSPHFGAARLPQETWVPEQPVPCLTVGSPGGSRARDWGYSFLPAPPCLGGEGLSHLLSGIRLTSVVRMECHRAEVSETAQSLHPSTQPPGTAHSQPGEGDGSLQPATCQLLCMKVPSQADYLHLILPCHPRPGWEPLGSDTKPLTTQA